MLVSSIMVSEDSFASDDEYDLIYSNIETINALFEKYVHASEMNPAMLQSYYVDYYLAQVNNGGFAQFVYNSAAGDDVDVYGYIEDGLAQMGAPLNLALFNKSCAIIEELEQSRIEAFINSELFGDNAERDILGRHDDEFYDLQDTEDLIALNHNWLKAHKDLKVLPRAKIGKTISKISGAIPDRAQREQEAQDGAPQYAKSISALCQSSGHTFDQITIGSYQDYQGDSYWHGIF